MASDYEGSNPLHYAVRFERNEILKTLLNDGRFKNALNAKDLYCSTVLDIAIEKNNTEAIDLLTHAMSIDKETLSKNIAPRNLIFQRHINKILSQYLKLLGRDPSVIINDKGKLFRMGLSIPNLFNNGT